VGNNGQTQTIRWTGARPRTLSARNLTLAQLTCPPVNSTLGFAFLSRGKKKTNAVRSRRKTTPGHVARKEIEAIGINLSVDVTRFAQGGYGRWGWQSPTPRPRDPENCERRGPAISGTWRIDHKGTYLICASAKYDYRLPALKAMGLLKGTIHPGAPNHSLQ